MIPLSREEHEALGAAEIFVVGFLDGQGVAERFQAPADGVGDARSRRRAAGPCRRPRRLKKRGASMASSRPRPKSTMLTMIWTRVGKMRRPPGEPRTRKGRPSLNMISGAIELTGRRPGRGRVGRFRIGVEVAHVVVEQEAGPFRDDAAAEEVVDRLGQGDDVAVLVDDGQMGGVLLAGPWPGRTAETG